MIYNQKNQEGKLLFHGYTPQPQVQHDRGRFIPVFLFVFIVLFLLSSTPLFAQTYQTNGDAVGYGNGLVRITSSTPAGGPGVWQTSSAWCTTKIDLNQPFDMSFDMFFGCESGINGGDGMTFTLQNQGLNALGGGGGFLGIGSPNVTPSVSIEFDTWYYNAPGSNDIPDDHIAIDINGDVTQSNGSVFFTGRNGTLVTNQAIANGRDLEDCAVNTNDFYSIRIVWDPASKTLQLYEEGTLSLTYTNDMVNTIFGGNNEVYWGFTGATGSASNEQWIAPQGTIIPWQCTANSCCAAFTPTSSSPTTICNNPVTLALDQTYINYSWSTGETTSTIDITAPGTYTVNVQQQQGGNLCPGSATITVLPTGPTATLSGGGTICNDGVSTAPLEVTLTGTAPWSLTYAIDGVDQPVVTNITSSPYTINGTAPHTYTLTSVTNGGGCVGSTAGSATVNAYTGLPVGHDGYFTAPGTADLSVTDEGGTYEWYDDPGAGSLVGTGADFTTPTLTTQTTYYVINTALSPFINKSISFHDNTEYGAGGNNTQTAMGLPRWDLWLDVTAHSNFTLNSISPDINVTADPQSVGSNVTIYIVDNTTSATTSYSLPISGYTAGVHNVTVPINYNFIAGRTYRVSYEGAGNVQGIMYWDFINSRGAWGPNPPATITADPEATLTVPNQGWYPGMFDWNIAVGSPAATCGRTPVTAYPCATGVISGSASICDDGTTTTALSVTLTGTAPWSITYAIDGVAQTPVTGITASPYVFQSEPGAHVYTLTAVSNAQGPGCTNNFSGTATVSVNPAAPAGHDDTFLAPGTADLSVDNTGGTYYWYDAPTGGNLVFTGNAYTTPTLTSTTTYYVEQEAGSDRSCTRTPVTAYVCPTAAISGTVSMICNDGVSTAPLTITLTGTAPWSVTYAIDGVAQTPITGIMSSPYTLQSATGAHLYTLTMVSTINSAGCSGNVNGSVIISVNPAAPTGHDNTFIPPAATQLSVDNMGATYNWYDAPTGGNLVYTGAVFNTPVLNGTTTYYVEHVVGGDASCERTPVTAVAVTPLVFPNLVTPNGDGNNDLLVIQGLPANSSVMVYNNWGSRIYNNKAYNNDWNPDKETDGMYYYDVKMPDGSEYHGWLQIMR